MDHLAKAIDHDLRAACGFVPYLKRGEPIPGCGCPECTGIPEDHPARAPRYLSGDNHEWEEAVEQARDIGLLEILDYLHIESVKKGSGWYCRCPLHDDENPSLHLSPEKGRSGLWYCHVCAVGGDPISLVMKTSEQTFPEAVRALTGFERKDR